MSDFSSKPNDAWISCIKTVPQAKLRLFCFPYAGGSMANFRTWADGLPATVEVWAATLPGRGAYLNVPTFTRIEPLVQAMMQVILPYLDRPFAFYGHSLGALISFELARLRCPEHLFISGRWAPQDANPDLPSYDLPEDKFMEEVRRLNGIPAELLEQQEILELLLPALRADLEVNETYTYVPAPPLNCPISAFGGLQDPKADRNALIGWKKQTTASFIVRMLMGDHFFLQMQQPLLLAMLSQELNKIVI